MTGPVLMPARMAKSTPRSAFSWRANSSVAATMSRRGEDRPLRVVLVGDRGTEEREHRVALELRDRALVAEDGRAHEVERLVDDRRSSPRGPSARASAVEPTTSANSAVTGLRSPVSCGPSRIFSMSGAGAADERRLRSSASAGSAGVIALPQFEQKRASAGTDASQFGQKTVTGSRSSAPSYAAPSEPTMSTT